MKNIKILGDGFLTTIQDKGRIGYQKYGMPVAGAMDDFAFRIANLLVGNQENEAAMEITLVGPSIQFNIETIIAITGANLDPYINEKLLPMWRSIKIHQGDVLSFKGLRSGCRGYIAIACGMQIESVMGSKSTYLRGCVGGFEGRKLKSGDEIDLNVDDADLNYLCNKKVSYKHIPVYENVNEIRVVLGPQDECFAEGVIKLFFESEYKVTNESDRMGYRLDGPKLENLNGADIISDGIALGSIQVPGDGMPIIMMADRQTTGGYTKIATIISSDLMAIAQMKPGDIIRFSPVTVVEAQELFRRYEAMIKLIKDDISNNRIEVIDTKQFRMNFNSKSGDQIFEVLAEEIKNDK